VYIFQYNEDNLGLEILDFFDLVKAEAFKIKIDVSKFKEEQIYIIMNEKEHK